MTPEQIEKLEELQERLADVFLDEADPRNWPGADVKQVDMKQQDRGDRVWIKKNAMGTVNLICRITTLLEPPPAGGAPDDEKEKRALAAAAEKEATELLERLGPQKRTSAKTPAKKPNAKTR